MMYGTSSNERIKKGLWLIQLTTMLTIWNARNEIIFSNHRKDYFEVVEEIKLLPWRCWIGSKNGGGSIVIVCCAAKVDVFY
jgi:hypothetical protein